MTYEILFIEKVYNTMSGLGMERCKKMIFSIESAAKLTFRSKILLLAHKISFRRVNFHIDRCTNNGILVCSMKLFMRDITDML